jgi:hypothetical protein
LGHKASVCERAAVDGYPTWVIDKKHISGERPLADLARFSSFPGEFDQSREPAPVALQSSGPCIQPGR